MSRSLLLIALCVAAALAGTPLDCFDTTQGPVCPNGTNPAGYEMQGVIGRDGAVLSACAEMNNGRSLEDMASDRDYQDTFIRVGVPNAYSGGLYCCKTACPLGTRVLGPLDDNMSQQTSSGLVRACMPDAVFADGFCCSLNLCNWGPTGMQCKCPTCDVKP